MKHVLVAFIVTVGLTPHGVRAHESRPLYVEIQEDAPLTYTVRWKAPPVVRTENAPTVSLPDDCVRLGAGAEPVRGRRRGVERFRCTESLGGRDLMIDYAAFNPSVSTLVRTSWLSGATHTVLGTPNMQTLRVPHQENLGGVAWEYLALGFRHILEGYDHLLFLVCLLLIAGTGKRILITVTGFTVAHSITLALSALDLVSVPLPPVEATIALSIVFLAVEILRNDRQSLTYRHPVIVATAFGLLHGFGFAAVLSEAGLPQTEVPAALLFFNVGVELGQLAFIGGAIALYASFSWLVRLGRGYALKASELQTLERPTAYVVGTLAAFWMFERIAGFWAT